MIPIFGIPLDPMRNAMSQEENKLSDERLAEATKRMQEALDLHDAEVADELASEGERADLWTDMDVLVEDVRTVLATLSLRASAGGEAVAWRAWCNPYGQPGWRYADTEQGLIDQGQHDRQPLYAAPSPSPSPVSLKPLEWEHLGSDYWRAPAPLFGSIRVERFSLGFTVNWSAPGISDTFVEGRWATADEAKAAAEAKYRSRILSALHPKAVPDVSEAQVERAANALWATLDLNGHTLSGVRSAARQAISAAQGVE